jgi:HPt (histidine-containing phosphotransfer) domain-containing protein
MTSTRTSEALDRHVLARLVEDLGGDGDTVRSLFDMYLQQLPGRLDAVAAAVSTGERDGIAFSAHALRSPSATLGLRAVAEASAELEALARWLRVDLDGV